MHLNLLITADYFIGLKMEKRRSVRNVVAINNDVLSH